jgi:hypothetical protein
VPVLKLPDFDKDFEIHSDASDFIIRIVLVQDGRLVVLQPYFWKNGRMTLTFPK